MFQPLSACLRYDHSLRLSKPPHRLIATALISEPVLQRRFEASGQRQGAGANA